MREVFSRYRTSAQMKGKPFEMTIDQFESMSQGRCHYCDAPPSNVSRALRSSQIPFVYNGIDRLNNDLGYVAGNVVTCCGRCNKAKNDMSEEAFRQWIATVYAHLFGA